MNRLPNFFIIGAMKAATSSLHDQLAAIDGLFMSDPKELYFFSDDPVYARGLDWYAAHFEQAADSDICGESTTHYAKRPTYPHTIDRIADHIDNPRFIYVMRHPIARLESQFTHMWLERELDVPFTEAIDGAVPELVDYSRYSYQLEPFFERFGAERVLPVFFDRLSSHGTEELRRVARFVGLDPALADRVEWNDALGANNVSAERLQQSAVRTTLKKVPGYDAVRSLVPDDAVDRLRNRWRPSERPELTQAQLDRVTKIFDADLAVLGTWLGVELTVADFVDITRDLADVSWDDSVLAGYPAST